MRRVDVWVDPWHVVATFNSLFEMHHVSEARGDGLQHVPFNSLFEMRYEELAVASAVSNAVLSILYLRC